MNMMSRFVSSQSMQLVPSNSWLWSGFHRGYRWDSIPWDWSCRHHQAQGQWLLHCCCTHISSIDPNKTQTSLLTQIPVGSWCYPQNTPQSQRLQRSQGRENQGRCPEMPCQFNIQNAFGEDSGMTPNTWCISPRRDSSQPWNYSISARKSSGSQQEANNSTLFSEGKLTSTQPNSTMQYTEISCDLI